MPKSVAYWDWKHRDNPFGGSSVLLALEGEEIIGVRAFMRWDWTCRGETIKAVRAVDTVTHPRHLRKGVFQKLTLSQLNDLKGSDIRFIFNTPNNSSMPGYLKMGWEAAGRLPVSFNVRRPFSLAANALGWRGSHSPSRDDGSLAALLGRTDEVRALLAEHARRDPELMRTALSLEYLKWRYAAVPVADSMAVTQGEDSLDAFAIARVKDSKAGRELRVTECIEGARCDRERLKNLLFEKARAMKVDVITMSGLSRFPGRHLTLDRGPAVTLFDLNDYERFHELEGFRKWSPSLGDLELF